MQNKCSPHLHSKFVVGAILELLEEDRISEVRSRANLHVSSPLPVSVQLSGRKKRMLDLRLVNECLLKSVKFEDTEKLCTTLR